MKGEEGEDSAANMVGRRRQIDGLRLAIGFLLELKAAVF